MSIKSASSAKSIVNVVANGSWILKNRCTRELVELKAEMTDCFFSAFLQTTHFANIAGTVKAKAEIVAITILGNAKKRRRQRRSIEITNDSISCGRLRELYVKESVQNFQ